MKFLTHVDKGTKTKFSRNEDPASAVLFSTNLLSGDESKGKSARIGSSARYDCAAAIARNKLPDVCFSSPFSPALAFTPIGIALRA